MMREDLQERRRQWEDAERRQKAENDRESLLLAKAVAEVVKRMRKEIGLSQEKLAELVGIHRTYMGLVEGGKNVITIRTAQRLCQALAITMPEFFEMVEKQLQS